MKFRMSLGRETPFSYILLLAFSFLLLRFFFIRENIWHAFFRERPRAKLCHSVRCTPVCRIGLR